MDVSGADLLVQFFCKWEKDFGEQTTPKAETMHEKLQRYQEKADRQNSNRPYQNRDKGAR